MSLKIWIFTTSHISTTYVICHYDQDHCELFKNAIKKEEMTYCDIKISVLLTCWRRPVFWFCFFLVNTRDLKKIRTHVVKTLNGRLVASKCEGQRLEDVSDHRRQNDKSLPWPILAAALTVWATATAATCRFASCDTAWPALLPRGVDKRWREI